MQRMEPSRAPPRTPTSLKIRTMNLLTETLDYAPRRAASLISWLCAAMLGYGMVLQHVVGLEPCPMRIVQRYALVRRPAAVAALGGVRASQRLAPGRSAALGRCWVWRAQQGGSAAKLAAVDPPEVASVWARRWA